MICTRGPLKILDYELTIKMMCVAPALSGHPKSHPNRYPLECLMYIVFGVA